MRSIRRTLPAVAFAASALVAGCDVEVRENSRRDADLDVQTPVGGLTVRSGVDIDGPGLPVYPGARPLRDRDEGDRASVRINSSLFDFEVQAAKFESTARPAELVEFYRREMAAFGDVVECQGDIDFKGGGDRGRRPVCDERLFERQTQLVVGTKELHRMMSVKPKGSGSEFALVYIDTRVAWD